MCLLLPGPAEAAYLNATSAEIGLKIAPEYQAAVNGDLNRMAAIAGFLMQFPLEPGCGSGAGVSAMNH